MEWWPKGELPEDCKDCIYIETEIHFDLKDRMKVLFGFKTTVRHRTYCEVAPGKVRTETKIDVWKPKPPSMEVGVVSLGPKE